MGLIATVLGCAAAGLLAGWGVDLVMRRRAARTLAVTIVDHAAGATAPFLVPPPTRTSCWQCDPQGGHLDGHLCPDCRLLLALGRDVPRKETE